MAFLELIDIRKIRKAIIYALCVIVTVSLQDLLFSRVAVWGAKPYFVPVIVMAIGLFEGGLWGALFGLVCGWVCDMSLIDNHARFLVLFAVLGFASGFLTEFFFNRRFMSFMLLALLGLIATAVCQIVPLWVFASTPLLQLLPTAGLQVLWSLPFAVPAYFSVKLISVRRRED